MSHGITNTLFPIGNLNNQNFSAFISDNTISETKNYAFQFSGSETTPRLSSSL